MGIASLCLVTSTKLIQPMVDDILISKDATQLLPISLTFLGVFLVKGLCDYLETVLLARFGQGVLTSLQVRCFQHIMNADLALFGATTTGDLISRLTNDVTRLRDVVTSSFVRVGKDALTVFGLIGVAVYNDPELSFISIFILPVVLWPGYRIGRRVRTIAGTTQYEVGIWSSFLSQCFQGARIVKACGAEDYETARAEQISGRVYDLTLRSTRICSIVHPLMEAFGGISSCLVISVGGWLVIQGRRTTGELFSFLGVLVALYRPLKSLLQLNATLQGGLATAQRLYAILETKPKIVDPPNAPALPRPRGKIVFEAVSFSYGEGCQALSDISFSIAPGQKIALVGASGAGKSTLFSLLFRFYDPLRGHIFIDDLDIAQVTQRSLRQALSLVSQEIILFDDTVRANIAYGCPHASFSAIQKAAQAAVAHEFIEALPQGYDTVVGENGSILSGGQKQRLSIARAMLKDAPILLLDEATSALDGDSEQKVQQALSQLTKGRTTLVIAHRLATILDADTILALHQGRLVEQGTHEDLLKRESIYAHLYASQVFQESPS
jgi:subfamily B ATP-binding cassette protein MsbA